MAAVVETLFDGAAGCRVESPTVEGWFTLGRAVGDGSEHRWVTCNLHLDSAIGQVEGVHRMEDVAGIDLAPLHVGCGAVERENPDSAGFVFNPVLG